MGCKCHKNPLSEGVGLVPAGDFCGSLIKKRPCKGAVAPWRLSCNLTRTASGLHLVKADEGPPQAVGGPSKPMRTRSAT